MQQPDAVGVVGGMRSVALLLYFKKCLVFEISFTLDSGNVMFGSNNQRTQFFVRLARKIWEATGIYFSGYIDNLQNPFFIFSSGLNYC
jgi:hypothetical protein